jgi:hypothetical protein
MIKQQFYVFIAGTIIYAWLFADALFTNHPVLTVLWGFLLFRKLKLAYRADRWIRLNERN